MANEMVYNAPLCKHPGCNRHTWSTYCQDHKNQKLQEIADSDIRSLSIADKQLLKETARRDTSESLAICESVSNALPGFFEGVPTPEEIETASLSVCFSGQVAGVARYILQHENEEIDTDKVHRESVVFFSEDFILSDEEVRNSAMRHDYFGRSPDDSCILSSYLLANSYKARVARGDKKDMDGISVEQDLASYAEDKFKKWNTDDVFDDYLSGLDNRAPSLEDHIKGYKQMVRRNKEHDSNVLNDMRGVRNEMGVSRMGGYTTLPEQEIGSEKHAAWSDCDTQYIPTSSQSDETQLIPVTNFQDPNEGLDQEDMTPKFINPRTGVIYNANMKPVGSTEPIQNELEESRKQQEGKRSIPDGMIRQKVSNVTDPNSFLRKPESSYHPESKGILHKTGSLLGRGVSSAIRAGWAVKEARREVDEVNRLKYDQFQQERLQTKALSFFEEQNRHTRRSENRRSGTFF